MTSGAPNRAYRGIRLPVDTTWDRRPSTLRMATLLSAEQLEQLFAMPTAVDQGRLELPTSAVP